MPYQRVLIQDNPELICWRVSARRYAAKPRVTIEILIRRVEVRTLLKCSLVPILGPWNRSQNVLGTDIGSPITWMPLPWHKSVRLSLYTTNGESGPFRERCTSVHSLLFCACACTLNMHNDTKSPYREPRPKKNCTCPMSHGRTPD